MGYTHSFYVECEYGREPFARLVNDFKRMVPVLKHLGVELAGGHGSGKPTISPGTIWFNGVQKCNHPKRELAITYPSNRAFGVARNDCMTRLEDLTKGTWHSGDELEARACNGDCSYETFLLERKIHVTMRRPDGTAYFLRPIGEYSDIREMDGTRKRSDPDVVGKFFQFCKTAYRPYDLAVNVCLIIAKHRLKDGIVVKSSGTENNWIEGKQLCQHFLGYGGDFRLDN